MVLLWRQKPDSPLHLSIKGWQQFDPMELLNTFEPDPEITLREVHTRDKGVCGWCHTSVELKDGEVDHIYPLSRGGKHTWENVQLTHFWCNSAKGNR